VLIRVSFDGIVRCVLRYSCDWRLRVCATSGGTVAQVDQVARLLRRGYAAVARLVCTVARPSPLSDYEVVLLVKYSIGFVQLGHVQFPDVHFQSCHFTTQSVLTSALTYFCRLYRPNRAYFARYGCNRVGCVVMFASIKLQVVMNIQEPYTVGFDDLGGAFSIAHVCRCTT